MVQRACTLMMIAMLLLAALGLASGGGLTDDTDDRNGGMDEPLQKAYPLFQEGENNEAVVALNKWDFRRSRRNYRRSEDNGDSGETPTNDRKVSWKRHRGSVDVSVTKKSGAKHSSTILAVGRNVAEVIFEFARKRHWTAYWEQFTDGSMFLGFGQDEVEARSSGGYRVELHEADGRILEPCSELSNYPADDYIRVVVEWADVDFEELTPISTQVGHDAIEKTPLSESKSYLLTPLVAAFAIATGAYVGMEDFLGSGVLGLVGTYEWTFRKKIQMETTANPSTLRAFERLGQVQMIAGDPIQNIIDAHDGGDEPAEAIFSLWDGEHALPWEKASKYFKDLYKHIDAVTDGGEISKAERLAALAEGPIAHMNIEDKNTLGLEGDESHDQISWVGIGAKALKLITENRFFWFFRAQNATSDDQNRRGSWGEGKFVLEAASLMAVQISLSIRKTADGLSRVLMGQTTLRWHSIRKEGREEHPDGSVIEDGTRYMVDGVDKNGVIHHDSFAPYGSFSTAKRSQTGLGYAPMPITEDEFLDEFTTDFRLERAPDQRGLSVVIPEPREELRDPPAIARAVIARWWKAIVGGNLVVRINHNGVEQFRIDSSSLREAIGDLDWEAEPEKIGSQGDVNPAAITKEAWNAVLDLHEWSKDAPEEAIFETAPASLPPGTAVLPWSEILPDSDKERFVQRCDNGLPSLVRLNTFVHPVGGTSRIGQATYAVMPVKEPLQLQFYTRRGMTIPFAKQSKGLLAIVSCDSTDLESLLRHSEGPAHLEWNPLAPRVVGNGDRWLRGQATVRCVIMAVKELHGFTDRIVIEESDYLEGFNIPVPSDGPPPPRMCKTCGQTLGMCICLCPICEGQGIDNLKPSNPNSDCPGHPRDPFLVIPTSRADGTIRVTRAPGFRASGKNISLKLAYNTSKGNPWSRFSEHDFRHDDLEEESTGATFKTSRTGKDGVEMLFSVEDEDFEIVMWGWPSDRDVRVLARDFVVKEVNA